MPNLKQLSNLKEKYGNVLTSNFRKSDVDILIESFDPSLIEKGFSDLKTKSFSFPDFSVHNYIEYFLKRKKARVVLLFIDITAFSLKFINKSTDELVKYLDDYYKYIIPLINRYGGEIEKIIGDGIVCVFGEPFLDENKEELHDLANKCSREIITQLKGSDFEVKIALHFGEVMYYQNPSDEYYDYTMIGSALTELFRLEGISYGNSINYFANTYYDLFIENSVDNFEAIFARYAGIDRPKWVAKTGTTVNLQGVNFSTMKRIEYTGA